MTYLQILVRSLLVFLSHSAWATLSKEADGREQRKADAYTGGCVGCDAPAFAWRWEGTWTVSAEGDVVCCLYHSPLAIFYPQGSAY